MSTGQRLARALATALAVLFSVLIFAHADLATRLFAGASAAFLMQCEVVGTRKDEARARSWMALSMMGVTFAGTALSARMLYHDIFLIAVAFSVFWARGLIASRPKFTVYVYTLAVLTHFGAADLHASLARALAVGAAFAITLIASMILPPHPDATSVTKDESSPATPEQTATTKTVRTMPFRAALACFLAIVIATALRLERGYWLEIAAVVLVNETWSESAQKSAQRFTMTAAGCIAGWLAHAVLAPNAWAERIALFTAVFLASYFRPSSYPKMIFFVTLYVSFLLSLFGMFSTHILLLRIEDTAIGCAVALACVLIVPPTITLPRARSPR